MTTLAESGAWRAVLEHARHMRDYDLRRAAGQDPARFDSFSVQHDGMLLDYSKHWLDADALRLLVELAHERDVPGAIGRMFGGERINNTENRAALHVALRGGAGYSIGGSDVSADVARVLAQMRAFADRIRNGGQRGHTGAAITDVVNIGIGGSYLGPELACDALQAYSDGRIRVHFLSNVDGEAAHRTLAALDPAATLFIVASKTFTTQETMLNARTARAWLVGRLGDESAVARHFVAVSSNLAETERFGIGGENVFEMWDWVGGRYSVWSAIGLPVALQLGMDGYLAMHAGARAMDEHFRSAPLARNMPVIMGLLDVWYGDALGATSRAVLPYAQALARLPAYLQQLEMESLGKRVTRSGAPVGCPTGGVVWGEPGTNGQHAFYQLLHQGTQVIPADFIAACRVRHPHAEHHAALLSNFFAQTEALMKGKTADEVRAEMQAARVPAPDIERLVPHRVFPGNRPTTSILVTELDPYRLGMLIALYEHKVYVQSVIWDINAFDQWGVELGKRLADRILSELSGQDAVASHDPSTNGLINYYKRHRS
jgi:glucose-6-phosphate isomerase